MEIIINVKDDLKKGLATTVNGVRAFAPLCAIPAFAAVGLVCTKKWFHPIIAVAECGIIWNELPRACDRFEQLQEQAKADGYNDIFSYTYNTTVNND